MEAGNRGAQGKVLHHGTVPDHHQGAGLYEGLCDAVRHHVLQMTKPSFRRGFPNPASGGRAPPESSTPSGGARPPLAARRNLVLTPLVAWAVSQVAGHPQNRQTILPQNAVD